jgi:hypothetical protein
MMDVKSKPLWRDFVCYVYCTGMYDEQKSDMTSTFIFPAIDVCLDSIADKPDSLPHIEFQFSDNDAPKLLIIDSPVIATLDIYVY